MVCRCASVGFSTPTSTRFALTFNPTEVNVIPAACKRGVVRLDAVDQG
jgi:hypothetical protein